MPEGGLTSSLPFALRHFFGSNMIKNWTSAEVERLHELRASNMGTKEIGAILRRSKNSVISRLNRTNQRPRGDPNAKKNISRAERDRAMAADFIGGMTHAELAAKYQLSKAYVAKCLGLRGVTLTAEMRRKRVTQGLKRSENKPGPAGIPPGLRADYRNVRRAGFSPAEAKKMLGLAA